MIPDVIEGFRAVARAEGGPFLFRRHDALRIVDRCQELGIKILGIDAFRAVGARGIQPIDDIDLSDAQPQESWCAARRFLQEVEPDRAEALYFEVVVP